MKSRKPEISISERIAYIKSKLDSQNTKNSEKLKIIEFFVNYTGIFGKKFQFETSFRELKKLTTSLESQKPRE